MRVDDSIPRRTFESNKHVEVPGSSMRKYNDWRRSIESGKSVAEASKEAGDLRLEKLKGNGNLCSIRLSQEHRVVFEKKTNPDTIVVHSIGGHY